MKRVRRLKGIIAFRYFYALLYLLLLKFVYILSCFYFMYFVYLRTLLNVYIHTIIVRLIDPNLLNGSIAVSLFYIIILLCQDIFCISYYLDKNRGKSHNSAYIHM